MTGLGLTTSDVNIDVQICAIASSVTTSTSAKVESPKDVENSARSQQVVWSAAKVMVKIAQILKDASGSYDNVKTDFQVRL